MAKTARLGPSMGKTESAAAPDPKFRLCYPMEFSGLIHKRPGYGPFFAENPFSPQPFGPLGSWMMILTRDGMGAELVKYWVQMTNWYQAGS